MPPGAILGPQNALNFIGFKGGRRNRAAKSTSSMKFRLFHGGKHVFTPVPETLVLPMLLIGILDIWDPECPPKRKMDLENALNFIRFNRGRRHWAARSTFPGQGRAGQGRALPRPQNGGILKESLRNP